MAVLINENIIGRHAPESCLNQINEKYFQNFVAKEAICSCLFGHDVDLCLLVHYVLCIDLLIRVELIIFVCNLTMYEVFVSADVQQNLECK